MVLSVGSVALCSVPELMVQLLEILINQEMDRLSFKLDVLF